MFGAYCRGFWERLLAPVGVRRTWLPSFELNLAYERGATLAESVTWWRVWQERGTRAAPSRFGWWLRTRARQRAALRAATWGARMPAARVKPEFGAARRHLHAWGDSPQN